MRILATSLTAVLCLCGCVDCGSFRDLDYADRTELPRLDALALDCEGSAIYGQVLVPSSKFEGPRPCAIICHGFAGFTRWDDIVCTWYRKE